MFVSISLNLIGYHSSIRGDCFRRISTTRDQLELYTHVYNIKLFINCYLHYFYQSVFVAVDVVTLGNVKSSRVIARYFDKGFTEMFLDLSSNNDIDFAEVIDFIGCHNNRKN